MNTLNQTEISRIRDAILRRFYLEEIPEAVLKPILLESLTDRMMHVFELTQDDEEHKHDKPKTYSSCKFLYDMVKFHPFVDGNKRSALAGFLALLKKNNITHKFSREETKLIKTSIGSMKISELPEKIIKIANDQISLEEFYQYVSQHTEEE